MVARVGQEADHECIEGGRSCARRRRRRRVQPIGEGVEGGVLGRAADLVPLPKPQADIAGPGAGRIGEQGKVVAVPAGGLCIHRPFIGSGRLKIGRCEGLAAARRVHRVAFRRRVIVDGEGGSGHGVAVDRAAAQIDAGRLRRRGIGEVLAVDQVRQRAVHRGRRRSAAAAAGRPAGPATAAAATTRTGGERSTRRRQEQPTTH